MISAGALKGKQIGKSHGNGKVDSQISDTARKALKGTQYRLQAAKPLMLSERAIYQRLHSSTHTYTHTPISSNVYHVVVIPTDCPKPYARETGLHSTLPAMPSQKGKPDTGFKASLW